MDLAGADLKRSAIQRLGGAEAFAHIRHRQGEGGVV
jgi:hypothetical protein